jgi:parallel beta-helix repeat protein
MKIKEKILVLCLCLFAAASFSMLLRNVGLVKGAVGGIIIYADRVEGTAADKIQRYGSLYVLSGSVQASIMVFADNIIIDGHGYTLSGDGSLGAGVALSGRINVTIRNMTITNYGSEGIMLHSSTSCNVIDNNIFNANIGVIASFNGGHHIVGNVIHSNSNEGIYLSTCVENVVSGNEISGSQSGILILNEGYGNIITDNTIMSNAIGISLGEKCINNVLYHNNFDQNTNDVTVSGTVNTSWDFNGEGNYWGSYDCPDVNMDGICDQPKSLTSAPPGTVDHYPLKGKYYNLTLEYQSNPYTLGVISNSSISSFSFDNTKKEIRFIASGVSGGIGFCRIKIADELVQSLWTGNCSIKIDGVDPLTCSDSLQGIDHVFYFAYMHSDHQVVIIPEFPLFALPFFLMAIPLTAILYRRTRARAITY